MNWAFHPRLAAYTTPEVGVTCFQTCPALVVRSPPSSGPEAAFGDILSFMAVRTSYSSIFNVELLRHIFEKASARPVFCYLGEFPPLSGDGLELEGLQDDFYLTFLFECLLVLPGEGALDPHHRFSDLFGVTLAEFCNASNRGPAVVDTKGSEPRASASVAPQVPIVGFMYTFTIYLLG